MGLKKFDGLSADITEEQRDKLRQLFPETFTEDKVDYDKLRVVLGEDVELGERYSLNFKGKSNVFRAIKEQTTSTLVPVRDESVNFDETKNLFIEGDNLEVLKILQKSYYNKIKMIYIDPPYNTGNDFIYNDKFSETRAEHETQIGGRDQNGNATRSDGLKINTGGHKHSNWLAMMYPRLFLAKNLLQQDGVIFISIDDNEVHNLRIVMNEIFGEENFLAQIIWQKIHSTKNDAKYFSDNHEYILVYARSIDKVTVELLGRSAKMDSRYQNPDNDPRGPWQSGDLVANETRKGGNYEVKSPLNRVFTVPPNKHWVYSKESMFKLIEEGRIWFGKDGSAFPRKKRFLSEVQQGKRTDTLWLSDDVGNNQSGKRELLKLFDNISVFETPKPSSLLRRIFDISVKNDKDSIVLDFFAGTGTLADSIMQMNNEDGGSRKYVMVQLAEKTDEKSEARKSGYETIADISKERIRRASKKIKDENKAFKIDSGFKVFKAQSTNFKIWDSMLQDKDELRQSMLAHLDPIKEGVTEEALLTELTLKSGLDLTTPRTKVVTEGGLFYKIENVVICLATEMTEQLFSKILDEKPEKIIFLDSSLKNEDQLKTNLLLQAEKSNIEVLVV